MFIYLLYRLTSRACAPGPKGCGRLPVLLTCPAVRLPGQRSPLVVLTGGFATEAAQYTELAEALAAGGYYSYYYYYCIMCIVLLLLSLCL